MRSFNLSHSLFLFLILATAVIASEKLSLEFLEYLASYESVDGELVDPIAFAEELEEMTNSAMKSGSADNASPSQHSTTHTLDKEGVDDHE